ncbi:MAG: hypothetical protein Q8P07_04340 [bacterium]|nr:hypothetical protein [bacterium]
MRDFSGKEIKDHLSSKFCRICGKEADGWKCPKCGKEAAEFDPFHWKECDFRAKMQTKCKDCQQAENNCTCLTSK